MIEAQSLAHVVELADSPPSEFNGSNTGIQPLVLYIARVPGSRDIFLTTVKPLDKVVRAGDVEGCLYYAHVDSPSDLVVLLQERNGQVGIQEPVERPQASAAANRQISVRRKPLPQQPQSSSVEDDRSPSRASLHYRPALPVRPIHQQMLAAHISPNIPQRPLIGPRPLSSISARKSIKGIQDPLQKKENRDLRWKSMVAPYSTENPVYRERQQELDRKYEANNELRQEISAEREADLLQSHGIENSTTGSERGHSRTSVTLIRRYDGNQANVAVTNTDGNVELLSPGYQKFKDQETLREDMSFSTNGQQQHLSPFRTLIRRMPHPTHSQELDVRGPTPEGPLASAKRMSKDFQGQSRHLPERTNDNTSHWRINAQPDSKHFVFSAPWSTKCAFSSGFAGRSLRCRTIPTDESDSTTISELKFNLPSSQALRSAPKDPRAREKNQYKRVSRFWKHQSSDFSAEDGRILQSSEQVADDDDDDRMDLSLGQEHAGGGLGGKQAKLGKLIIQPEGLQMLDLLVAANMSMWWRVYDKVV